MRSTSTKVRGLVKAAATPRGVLGSSKAVITTLLLQAFPLRFGRARRWCGGRGCPRRSPLAHTGMFRGIQARMPTVIGT